MIPKSTSLRVLAVLGLVAFVALLSVEPAFAQSGNPINFGGIENKLANTLRPVIGLVKTVLAVLAVLFGMFEAFKASRGSGGGWFKALGLFIVAALIMVPTFILETFGMSDLAAKLASWGF